MKETIINDLLRGRNIVIPLHFLKYYKNLDIDMDVFVFLMYLYNLGDKVLFDPNKFSKELNIDLSTVMNYVSLLTGKGLLKVDVVKNDKNLMEEVIVLDDFYNKFTYITLDEYTEDNSNSTIFSLIESEFGRTLSPIEVNIINAWLEHHFSEDLIKEALKEAVFNGVSNLKYIDRILYEWEKNGVKTIEDVEKRRKEFQKNKEKDSNIDIDIVDWDWFDEDN